MINPSYAPALRIFRKLDTESLTQDFIDKVLPEEGSIEYVDSERARDYPYTEEIMETTVGVALVNEDGEILAEWEGKDAFAKANAARKTAKITFSVDVDVADKPKRASRAKPADETTETKPDPEADQAPA